MSNEIKSEARIKKISSNIGFGELTDLMEVLTLMLRGYGEFILKLGKLESEHGKELSELGKISQSPEFMQSIIKKAPPEFLGSFVKTMFQFSVLSSKMNNWNSLPPTEKIDLGKMIIDFSKEIGKLLEKK